MLLPIMLAASTVGVSPPPAFVPVRTQISPGPDQQALAVARMVSGIISYSRWPGDLAVVRICVMGNTRFADRLGDAKPPAGLSPAVRG